MKRFLINMLLSAACCLLAVVPLKCVAQQYAVLGAEKSVASTDTIVFSGKTVVWIGDSYFAGYPIPDSFAAKTGCINNNLGISGQVLQNGNVCNARTIFNKTTIPTYIPGTHAAIIFDLGTNDIGVNNGTFTVSGYGLTLDSVIDYAVNTKGWPRKRFIVMTAYYTTQAGRNLYVGTCSADTAFATRLYQYADEGVIQAVANVTQIVNIQQEQIDTGNPDALMAGDGIHPSIPTGVMFIVDGLRFKTYYLSPSPAPKPQAKVVKIEHKKAA